MQLARRLPPAVRAFLLQAASFPAVLLAGALMSVAGLPDMTLAQAAVLQGALAALMSRGARLAAWWIAIQALFPVLLIAALSLHLPPVLFLAAFLLLMSLYWSTFRTQVPFYPSGRALWASVSEVLPAGRPLAFIDIGSGLGGLVLELARRHPDAALTGIEIAPLPWAASLLRRWIGPRNARFIRGDYQRLDLGAYQVVFAYLSPAAMPRLWEQARAQMRPGTLLLSYEFAVPGVQPDFAKVPADATAVLYGWFM